MLEEDFTVIPDEEECLHAYPKRRVRPLLLATFQVPKRLYRVNCSQLMNYKEEI